MRDPETTHRHINPIRAHEVYDKLYHDGTQIEPALFKQLSTKLLDIGIDEKALNKRQFMNNNTHYGQNKRMMTALASATIGIQKSEENLNEKQESRAASKEVRDDAKRDYQSFRFAGLRRLKAGTVRDAYPTYQGNKKHDIVPLAPMEAIRASKLITSRRLNLPITRRLRS